MPLDITGFDVIDRTTAYELLMDRGKNGLLALALRSFGEGMPSEIVPVSIAVGEYAFFRDRVDLPDGTVFRATDVGSPCSFWRCTIDDTGAVQWVPDRPFDIFRATGATGAGLGTPVAVINGPVIGFNRFGPLFSLPAAFFPINARQMRVKARILRTTGTGSTTMRTQVLLGGVAIYDAQWTNNVIVHEIEFDFWASDTTQVTAQGHLMFTSTVATPVATMAVSSIETAVAGLNVSALNLEIGIFDTVAEAGLLKLVEVSMEVLR